ncbi:hypothetical protein DENSPDRAFT_834539 [Dentipellis sp. KUC8613]|nr:hypothetical protein DENSPDRAFT_834539 [Dentipellis sp. KUC8613]
MGFLKRFLSIGSKRHKKKRAPLPAELSNADQENRRRFEQEQEATASRLLRSSSSHFSVVSEVVDYASLPPLPHPINSLSPTPTGTSSDSASVQTRGTYTVKVHGRKVHARTEFPNANPRIETPTKRSDDDDSDSSSSRQKLSAITPRDKTRLHRLRQDPSVASLLDMYDSHGRLDEKAFSNSFTASSEGQPEGKPQVKRSGSTLRQLLGSPIRDSTTEGDISWAERFLGEADATMDAGQSASSVESLGLETPTDPPFDNDHSIHVHYDTTVIPEHDLSTTDSENYPIFSSMEVELSMADDTADLTKPAQSQTEELSTPRRASSVFGFLLEKDQAKDSPSDLERPLPALPTHLNVESSMDSDPRDTKSSTLPSDTSDFLSPSNNDHSGSVDATSSAGSIIDDPPQTATIVNRTPVSRSILRETRAQQLTVTPSSIPTSRIPRGPRGPRTSTYGTPGAPETPIRALSVKSDAKPSSIPVRDALRTTTNAKSFIVPLKSEGSTTPAAVRKAQRRTASHGSNTFSPRMNESTLTLVGDKTIIASSNKASRVRPPKDDGKENGPSPNTSMDNTKDSMSRSSSSARTRLPMTPARTRALFDVPPSPASSTELSPLAQQMMAEAREHRARARADDRRKNRLAVISPRD